MSKPQPYKLIVTIIVKSKAKLFGFFPIKSVISGEFFEIHFQFENISEETFPGTDFLYSIEWPSVQSVRGSFPIGPLKKNQFHGSPPITTHALCEGFGLIFIKGPLTVKDKQARTRQIEYYSGKRVEDHIDIRSSSASVIAKSWEEVYEFWAMIISATALMIIALEKIFSFLNWLIP